MKFMLFAVLGSVFLTGIVLADDLATAVVGRWAADGKTLEFYGRNIGQWAAETTKYFKYEFPSEGQLSLNYGGGTTDQFTISIASNELRLVDSAQQETVYTKVETNLNPCVRNLRELDGAMSLFSLDHEGATAMGPGDLIPVYLPDLPTCPDGGIYNLMANDGHPACTVTEHAGSQ